jgi:16S rRNA (cytosine967-C5)-methyltransferase
MKEDPRLLAVDMLLEIDREEVPCHLVIRRVLDHDCTMPLRDRNFCRRLTEGTIERCIFLDYMIDQVAKTRTRKMKPVIRWIIRTAAYQIWFMSVPDRAAVSEALRITARKGCGPLKGFVNGVLRNLARRKDTLKLPDRVADPEYYLSIRYSLPRPIVHRWMERYGEEKTEAAAASFEKKPPLTVRLRGDAAALTGELESEGISVTDAPYVPDARILSGVTGLEELPAFRRGALAVQDVSSMIAVRAAGIRRTSTVLDLCAAPGGKTMLAADLAPEGRVLSRDLTEKRVSLIRSAAERLGIHNVTVQCADASVFDPVLRETADVVLADVPCSGLGVIGRKPDIRYRMSDAKTESLVKLQREILSQAVRYIRPGGTLLYSTCTIDERENEENAEWICDQLGLEPCALAPDLPDELKEKAGDRSTLQLLPGTHRCDGFFLAKFRKG